MIPFKCKKYYYHFSFCFFYTDELVGNLYPWIGLYDYEGSNNGWKWTDGTQYDFTAWYPSEPSDINDKCVYVSKFSFT